jgi:hypothetical protein
MNHRACINTLIKRTVQQWRAYERASFLTQHHEREHERIKHFLFGCPVGEMLIEYSTEIDVEVFRELLLNGK